MNISANCAKTQINFLDESLCLLCGACKEVCPSKALRIADGKPVIDADRCSWCASCAKVCPTGALSPVIDAKTEFNPTIALLLPPSLYGMEDQIQNKSGCAGTIQASAEYDKYFSAALASFNARGSVTPVILSACPAVTRFVQITLPGFAGWLHESLPPMELSAKASGRICAFVAPCPAKIADIENRKSKGESFIDHALPSGPLLDSLGLGSEYQKKITPREGLLRIEGLKNLEAYLRNWKEGQDGVKVIEALSCPDCSEGFFLQQHKITLNR
jgi:Fe-S-cluster-containing hydrogenase component 2